MEWMTNDELFEECYLLGLECDKNWEVLDDYFQAVEHWKYVHDEVKRRGLQLAYIEYCSNRNLLGV